MLSALFSRTLVYLFIFALDFSVFSIDFSTEAHKFLEKNQTPIRSLEIRCVERNFSPRETARISLLFGNFEERANANLSSPLSSLFFFHSPNLTRTSLPPSVHSFSSSIATRFPFPMRRRDTRLHTHAGANFLREPRVSLARSRRE